MSREAIPQLPPAAEGSISRFPANLHHKAANHILNLSHVELHTGDTPIPRQDIQAEQHGPHIDKVKGFMGRASNLLGTAHNQLSESGEEPEFEDLAAKAKDIALASAKQASKEGRSKDTVRSMEDLLVIEALSATDPATRQPRSEKIFSDIKEDESLVDSFIVASHETFGLVARHGEELVPLNSVAQNNEAGLSNIKTRDYKDNFSEISPITYKEAQEDKEKERASFESIKELATPLLAKLEAEAKQSGIQDTQLHERNMNQIKGGLAILQGLVNPHEGLSKLQSRHVFISHPFYPARIPALQASLALDAKGMMPRMDNKGSGNVIMDTPQDPSADPGPRFYKKWKNEFRESIKQDGNGYVILTPETIDSEVIAWEIGVMIKKNCNIFVLYDETQTTEDGKTAMDKLEDVLADYKNGKLETPAMLAEEGGDIGQVWETIKGAQKIKIRPHYYDDQEKLGNYLIDSMTDPSTTYPEDPEEGTQGTSVPGPEAAELDMGQLWGELKTHFSNLKATINHDTTDPYERLLRQYKVDQTEALIEGIAYPEGLAAQLKKKTLSLPDALMGKEGTTDKDFFDKLRKEFEGLGFEVQPDTPPNNLNVLLQTANTLETSLEPVNIGELDKFMAYEEPFLPIFIGKKIFTKLGQPAPARTELSADRSAEYQAKRAEIVKAIQDRQTLVFNDDINQMSPETRSVYTKLMARSLTTKFRLNELALGLNEARHQIAS